ncbi:Type II secretion system protein G precursor [Phycisphaerae bacterium RAS2]|nr:Type II secretion system protein G precursor [Phycisphaerae bacterium RAS2]
MVTKRRAFTLIELLTVMAIIVLLIGILVPALGAARDRARRTATKAQIKAMTDGLEAFHADKDSYPPSNPGLYTTDPYNLAGTRDAQLANWALGNGANELQGAHLLADVLVGRDMLGYDPMPSAAGTTYDRWNPSNDRQKYYSPADGVSMSSLAEPPSDGGGEVPNTLGNPQPLIAGNNPQPGSVPLLARVFVDRFGWPILYYRANPTSNADSPIISQTDAVPAPTDLALAGNGFYDGMDNQVFTSYDQASPYNRRHRIADANLPITTADYDGLEAIPNQIAGSNGPGFAEFIRSFRATTYTATDPKLIRYPRPVRMDSFIILSAGKDGFYGNLDDVANFAVLSEER